ncbi:MAG: winged helix-turn-helix domain-containing protein [Syntrophales bacterium]|jgi:hypothetical protein|nr:winged helix-turn-helix domain-containing protein [Syntrophales bacterium]
MVIELLDDLTLDPHIIRILRGKHLQDIQAMQEDILAELPVLSNAMKKIVADISRLAEFLHEAAGESGRGGQELWKIYNLSQRLISGVTEIGMILSQVGLWRLNENYFGCQSQVVGQGQIRMSVSTNYEESLRKIVPDKLSEWVHQWVDLQPALAAAQYRELHLLLKDPSPGKYCPPEKTSAKEDTSSEVSPSLTRIQADPKLLAEFRKRLAGMETLHELIPAPPELVIDSRRRRCFYRGVAVSLTGKAFDMLALLAGSPGKLITRAEIYDQIWADDNYADEAARPYDRQITDHKYRIIAGIKKAAASADNSSRDLHKLILSRFGSGYILNLPPEEVCLLP